MNGETGDLIKGAAIIFAMMVASFCALMWFATWLCAEDDAAPSCMVMTVDATDVPAGDEKFIAMFQDDPKDFMICLMRDGYSSVTAVATNGGYRVTAQKGRK